MRLGVDIKNRIGYQKRTLVGVHLWHVITSAHVSVVFVSIPIKYEHTLAKYTVLLGCLCRASNNANDLFQPEPIFVQNN